MRSFPPRRLQSPARDEARKPRRRLPRLLLSSPNEHLGTAPAAPALRGKQGATRPLSPEASERPRVGRGRTCSGRRGGARRARGRTPAHHSGCRSRSWSRRRSWASSRADASRTLAHTPARPAGGGGVGLLRAGSSGGFGSGQEIAAGPSAPRPPLAVAGQCRAFLSFQQTNHAVRVTDEFMRRPQGCRAGVYAP